MAAHGQPGPPPPDLRPGLRADCGQCAGLCCVATAFAASADFAISKAAGRPCPHLRPDFGCDIHGRLREQGFAGCARYDCFGAGQQVIQVSYAGRDWRAEPEIAGQMFGVFAVMRQLHELLWYLSEAQALAAARPLHAELADAVTATLALTRASPAELGGGLGPASSQAGRHGEMAGLNVAAHWAGVNALLLRASDLARAQFAGPGANLRGSGLSGAGPKRQDLRGADLRGADLRAADLAGADLRDRDLRGASLRGACLIGARLTGADLAGADFTGADLRDADLRGAELRDSLFLTRPALAAARTDAATGLPPTLAG